MSNEARQRDITALLARGLIRVGKKPSATKAINATIPTGQAQDVDTMRTANGNPAAAASDVSVQHGGDQ